MTLAIANTQVLLFLHGGSLQLIVLWAQGGDATARLRLDSWEAAAEIKATAPVALVAYESLVASIQARHTTRPRTR